MLQCLIRFPEFGEFSELNQRCAPFREKSNVFFCRGGMALSVRAHTAPHIEAQV